ncbi:hypothetical protein ACQ4LE_007518 [Meloidogyne hapla]
MASNQWNRRKLNEVFPNNNISLNWCINNGFIPSVKECRIHHQPMCIEAEHGKFGRFVCNRGSCRGNNRQSRVNGTWFENVKIDLPAVFSLMYSFSRNESYEEAINEAANRGRK